MSDQPDKLKGQQAYLHLAKTFRDQFAQVPSQQLLTLLRLMGNNVSREQVDRLFHDTSLKVDEEPMWRFMHSCTMLVVMTELENRRGVGK